MGGTQANVYLLDAAYKPFPPFEEWASRTSVDTVRWHRYNASLSNRPELSPDVLKRAREIAKRFAALDTGAIEGLYEVDRGFTYTVAFETAAWETELANRGEHVRPLFEAQLHAYDYVLDLATKAEPISEAAIRVLHEVVCQAQATYRVATAVGPQEQALTKGRYKVLPNHVRTRDGADHSYAPVDVTPAEMARLVSEMRSEAFLAAHPVLQAAYAHYGLVVIHPFADGNGRVARALASVFTYRAISMPIVILSEHKEAYLDALESADGGNYQSFVDFMLARSLDTITLVNESVLGALSPSAEQSVEAIRRVYLTKGGYTHDQVEASGKRLIETVRSELLKTISENAAAKVHGRAEILPGVPGQSSSTHRSPLNADRRIEIRFNSDAPAHALIGRHYDLWLPQDAGCDDDVQLERGDHKDKFSARMDELLPTISGVLQIRIALFAERVIGEVLAELRSLAEQAIKGQR
ncbi:MAG: Fic family protein [Terracidiphilus sp.]